MNLLRDAFESVLWYFTSISQFAFTGLILDLFQVFFINLFAEFSLTRISKNIFLLPPAFQRFEVSDVPKNLL